MRASKYLIPNQRGENLECGDDHRYSDEIRSSTPSNSTRTMALDKPMAFRMETRVVLEKNGCRIEDVTRAWEIS